ncbi:MAG: tyrosine-type recombinase/integrase [Deltaproteobacteria bacterium]|nr:tyrosine-type recombinase/integrase [Deltaproteobacteria bacterium]
MGSIYKRGNNYSIKYHINGITYRESSGSHLKSVAKQFLATREGEIAQGKLPGLQSDRITFDELADDFLTDYRINGKKTLKRAQQSIQKLREFFGNDRVINITTSRLKKYVLTRLDEDAANGTVNRELSALRRMFNLGAKCTPPKVNQVPHFPMLKENNVRKGFFELVDFMELCNVLPDYLKPFVVFAYRTGLRKSEITNLTWAQVDRVNGIVSLNPGETKNNQARTLPLDNVLKEVISQQWEARKQCGKLLPFVFLNQGGTGQIKYFRKSWKSACTTIGKPDMKFHDLRRSAVRNMVRAGTPEKVVMIASGHRTRSVFDRYNIVNDSDLRLAAEKQAAYLENQMGTILGTISKKTD